MTIIKILILLTLVFGVQKGWCQQPVENPLLQTGKLDWIAGTWVRTNVKPGRQAYERWEKVSESEWIGYGVSMQGQDTVFFEKLKIVVKDNAFHYVADVPENKRPVYFRFTTMDDNGFECENPGHDFPKKITYHYDGHRLRAVVSGNGKSTEFLFERK